MGGSRQPGTGMGRDDVALGCIDVPCTCLADKPVSLHGCCIVSTR